MNDLIKKVNKKAYEEAKVEEEKVDWAEEWRKLKSNKIFLIAVFVVKIVYNLFKKGGENEKDKKSYKRAYK